MKQISLLFFALAACSSGPPYVHYVQPDPEKQNNNTGLAANTQEAPDPPLENVVPGNAGTLDPSFGQGGITKISFSSGEHQLSDIAVLPDGKLVVTGHMPFSGPLDFGQQILKPISGEYDTGIVVLRLDADGKLDTSFGVKGGVRIGDRSGFSDRIAAMPDGKLYVSGYQRSSTFVAPDLVLARLLPQGTIDLSFGNKGIVVQDFGGSDDRPSAVLPMPDGGVIVVGIHSRPQDALGPGSPPPGRVTRFPNDYENYAARFTPKGELDSSFGKNGVAFFDVTDTREFVTNAKRLADGRIVVCGYVVRDDDVFAARLLPNGSLDPSFGTNGSVVMGDTGLAGARALAVDAQGHIYLGGQTQNDGPAAVLKLLPDGRRDSSFGDYGVARSDPKGDDQLYFLGLLGDGKVVGAGFRGLANDAQFFLTRFTPRGKLDPSVQGRGFGLTRISNKGDFAVNGALDSMGRLLLVGYSEMKFSVARYRM